MRSLKNRVRDRPQKQPFADFFKIGVPKNLVVFTGKRICGILFLIKLQAFSIPPGNIKNLWFSEGIEKACNFIKIRLQHKCFPVNIGKFLRTTFS